jgi:two-component system response regulator VicR
MPKRILIIDDDPDILEILNLIFEQEGFEVKLSETGEEAEQLAHINPDLVLLDIRILGSGKNGADICYKIKSRPETQFLPILLFSSEENIEEISEQCGADGYISKPFEVEHLMVKVKKILAA